MRDDDRNAGVYQLRGCKRVCLLPRLSLSELLYASGLVRSVCERSAEVMVVARRDHARSLRNLYEDVHNLRFAFVGSWDELYAPQDHKQGRSPLEVLQDRGYHVVPLQSFRQVCPYAVLGLESELARAAFAVKRDTAAEYALLERVRRHVGEHTPYAVVHDDENRRIRPHLIPDGLEIVSVRDPRWRTDNAFDWIQVIDNAMQFHGIDSCFMLMADLLDLRPRKFCHAYADPEVPAANARRRSRNVIVVWG